MVLLDADFALEIESLFCIFKVWPSLNKIIEPTVTKKFRRCHRFIQVNNIVPCPVLYFGHIISISYASLIGNVLYKLLFLTWRQYLIKTNWNIYRNQSPCYATMSRFWNTMFPCSPVYGHTFLSSVKGSLSYLIFACFGFCLWNDNMKLSIDHISNNIKKTVL